MGDPVERVGQFLKKLDNEEAEKRKPTGVRVGASPLESATCTILTDRKTRGGGVARRKCGSRATEVRRFGAQSFKFCKKHAQEWDDVVLEFAGERLLRRLGVELDAARQTGKSLQVEGSDENDVQEPSGDSRPVEEGGT